MPFVRFSTDGSVQNRGFRLNYTTEPALCGGILRDSHGLISSPTNTEQYPNNAECSWIISVSSLKVSYCKYVHIYNSSENFRVPPAPSSV